ncbi:hypothetical protein CRUP_024190 [Coryphaenoides rupestris]|nr:hypothetical protein CRUP_024190 [Coryphaenoides rupestris]
MTLNFTKVCEAPKKSQQQRRIAMSLKRSRREAEEPGARPGHAEGAGDEEDEEPASGVSVTRAQLTVAILCYINLLNYMDRLHHRSYMILAPCFGYPGRPLQQEVDHERGHRLLVPVTLASSYTPPHDPYESSLFYWNLATV